jgi:hypothetical protein
MLRHHVKTCTKQKETCPCLTLAQENVKDDDTPERQMVWHNLVRSVMMDCLERFGKSSRLHMLHAFVQHEKLNNKYKALYELMITEENKPTLQEGFSIYRYK